MKFSHRSRLALIALLLALCTLFASCDIAFDSGNTTTPAGTSAQITTPAQTTPSATTPEESTPADTDPIETDPIETDPIVTDPIETDPIVTDPVVTDPIETDPIETDPIETDPIETDPIVTDPIETDPIETDPIETDPIVTEPVETDPIETDPVETDPVETEPVETDPLEPELPALSMPAFDISTIPEYSKDIYVEINGNVPFFTPNQITNTYYEYYSPLDSIGRCGITVACIGRDLMPTANREDISSVRPTGWVQAQYGGSYLYNRSHLIGFQLTGENANKKNLITGTAYFNVAGMLPFENMVADYIKETGNHVLYRVTPVFVGNELVARGVIMEAWSVEDDGDGICFNVFVYNVQPGVEIDYATGKSTEKVVDPGDGDLMDFVLNKSTKKFHLPTCTYALSMSEANKQHFHTTLAEMLGLNYIPCKSCKPDEAAA